MEPVQNDDLKCTFATTWLSLFPIESNFIRLIDQNLKYDSLYKISF